MVESIKEIRLGIDRERERTQAGRMLSQIRQKQITERLVDAGFSPVTAANAAEIALAVLETLVTGQKVAPRELR